MTDGELVRQVLAGRTDAYEELVRRWTGRITALCHAKLGCAATADDIAQETLVKGYRALDSLSKPENFGAWLCMIARNNCVNWLRAKVRTQVHFSALSPEKNPEAVLSDPAYDDGPALDREDEVRRLKEEVEALPEEYREVLRLYYHENHTYRDLAQMLGVSAATINARLTKARALLRDRLSKCPR